MVHNEGKGKFFHPMATIPQPIGADGSEVAPGDQSPLTRRIAEQW